MNLSNLLKKVKYKKINSEISDMYNSINLGLEFI